MFTVFHYYNLFKVLLTHLSYYFELENYCLYFELRYCSQTFMGIVKQTINFFKIQLG